ncbi:MAG: hypothetical protein Q4G40_02220 [Brachybacterium sp.]|nr:hypothetical protein [Brachybacterium sp.]
MSPDEKETASTPDAGDSHPAEGKAQPAGDGPSDPVDEGTKHLAADEAEQHDSPADAQETDAEESGGYGH